MADDLQNYKLQLQQVEAALLSDSTNDELLKLKVDLEEVIDLTRDIIKSQLEESSKPQETTSTFYDDDEITASLLAAEGHLVQANKIPDWVIGDKCLAKWSEDGQYYSATIEGITDSGDVNVVFEAYQNRDSTTLAELKVVTAGTKRNFDDKGESSNKKGRVNQREYLKKKKQKKQLRHKEIEAEREVEKNKWLSFSTKASKKTGLIKPKSIFASPDNANGRVGIGTCGVSGKPMTEFSHGEKWRKGV